MRVGEPRHGARRILLVDDSAAQRDLYAMALESDCDVLTAARDAVGTLSDDALERTLLGRSSG